MKKKLLIGGVAAAVLLLGAALTVCFYTVRPLDLFGQTVRANAAEYTLPQGANPSFDALLEALSPLTRLTKLNLGDYPVEVREEERLQAAFPRARILCQTHVSLYGLNVDPAATELDLTEADLSDLQELRAALPYLKQLKTLSSAGTAIPQEDLAALRSDFPEITFQLVSLVDVFGKIYRDDVTSLDLTGAALPDDLAASLALLPALREVDLRGKSLSTQEQLALAEAFPEIAFRWEVTLLDTVYDSYIEDLDLSGNKSATPDLMREYSPLFPRMTRLDLSDCGASNEEMAALRADLPGVKVVWRIHMGQWSLKTDAVAFSVLIYNYEHTRLTSKDIQVLQYCTDLQALDLGHQAITDISVIGEYLPELRILILVDNQVSDLTPVAKLKHLHYIELFVNSPRLTDLSPLAQCKELVDVNVSYLYGVRDFSALFDLPLLERLWMEHVSISAEQLQTIKDRYPNATVITQGKGSIDNGWRTHERYFAMIGMFHDDNCRVLSESFSKYDQ